VKSVVERSRKCVCCRVRRVGGPGRGALWDVPAVIDPCNGQLAKDATGGTGAKNGVGLLSRVEMP
jgi:hypothetical protein